MATTTTRNRATKNGDGLKEVETGKRVHIPPPSDDDFGQVHIAISPPNIRTMSFTVRGTAPFVQNKFSQKALNVMKSAQQAGSQSGKGKKKESKNFEECYEGAKHVSREGWIGIPAPAFRCACIDACRMAGFAMTHAKMSVFVIADGFDADDGTPLVKITKGEPRYVEHAVRNASGVADIRARPMWDVGWEAEVKIEFDADQFSMEDVTNLLLRAGRQVGVGEGRPFSKKSAGMGWGTFTVLVNEDGE